MCARADADNPNGYYEYERVKGLPEDRRWLELADGKAVKVISALLEKLPDDLSYKVLFLRRDLREVLASQRRMLERRGEVADPAADEHMAELFTGHLARVEEFLAGAAHCQVLHLDYAGVVDRPEDTVAEVAAFLNRPLDVAAMVAAVDAGLYRNRKSA